MFYVSVTGSGGMALPYEFDGSQVSERTFPQAAPSLSRPSKRLAPHHTQYLAAEYSFSDLNFIRPFGSDRNLKGYDEVFNAIIMLVVAVAFSIVMLGPWGFIKDAANVTESKQIIPFLIYLAAIWGSALLIVPGFFLLVAKGACRLAGIKINRRVLTLRLAYILIPIGIFAWIAFSLPTIMANYGYIISVFSDPLGLGWDLLGTADSHFKALRPDLIPVIQGLVLLAGLYLGITRGFMALKELLPDPGAQIRAMLLPSVFAVLAVNLLLKLYIG